MGAGPSLGQGCDRVVNTPYLPAVKTDSPAIHDYASACDNAFYPFNPKFESIEVMASQLIGLFPTPFVKVDGFLTPEEIAGMAQRARAMVDRQNSATDLLSHTELVDPASDAYWRALTERVNPHLVRFGDVLFARELKWTVKEIWMNLLKAGGSQFMHTHANSFASGIFYITTPAPSAATVFRKPSPGGEFIFRNDVPLGHYSADTWQVPDIKAGDLVLYPSYLMHGVPPNDGPERITVAFNAIPDELDSLGYKIRFGV